MITIKAYKTLTYYFSFISKDLTQYAFYFPFKSIPTEKLVLNKLLICWSLKQKEFSIFQNIFKIDILY